MDEKLTKYFSDLGRKGGKKSAAGMTKAARIARAKKARATQLAARRKKKGGSK
jgi:calcineurin-like phosphoesterase